MAESTRISLWLPDDLLERLRARPDGVSEEIRRRVEQSFARDSMDQRTVELEAAITVLAGLVEYDDGVAWHSDPRTHAVFVQLVMKLLAEAEPKDPKEASRDLLAGKVTKQTDPPAQRAEQLFRTYLAMQRAAAGTGSRPPSRIAMRKKGGSSGKS